MRALKSRHEKSGAMHGLSRISEGCHSRLATRSAWRDRESRIRFDPEILELDSRLRGNDRRMLGVYRIEAILFAALLLLGAAVRIYGAWQLRHNLNPDSGIAALMAKHMAEGTDFPVFFYGQAYMGSLEPLVSALFCALFGTSGFMVTLGTALVGWLVLFAVFVWARDAHSPAAGLAAMAYCVIGPAGFVHYQASPRGGYAVTILFSTLILWLISRLIINAREDSLRYSNFPSQADLPAADKVGRARRLCLPAVLRPALQAGRAVWGRAAHPEDSPYRSEVEIVAPMCEARSGPDPSSIGGWFILGLLAGLGWWSNQLIISAILTAGLMGLLFLRARVFSFNTLFAALGFFIGSLPFWWWNVLHGWQSFAFAGSLGQTPFIQGLSVFFFSRLPDLLDLNHGLSVWRIGGGLIYLGAAVFFVVFLWNTMKNRGFGRASGLARMGQKQICLLTAFVFVLVSALLFSTSHFALMSTSRYLLPLVPVIAVVFGVMTAELAKRKTFFLGVIPLAVVMAGQAANLSWLPQRGAGEEVYQRQIEECGKFLLSHQIGACYAPYGKHSWNFAFQEKICFCDLPQDRYLPYTRRAELADKIAVFDNFGDINNFIANYGGMARTIYSDATPICWDFKPPQEGLAAIPSEAIESICDSFGRDILAEATDNNLDTGWEGVAEGGDDEWLEIAFKTPQVVRMIRLLYREYPEMWQVAGQGMDDIWRTLTPCIQTSGYLWSGPRPYWGYGLEGYRLECPIPPEKLKQLRIYRIQSGYKLLEIQLFAPAAVPESESSALSSLVDLLRQRGLKRLYCDRWPANAVFRETQGAVETPLLPTVFGDCSLTASNALWFTPRTGILVREEDAALSRKIMADRMLAMRQTRVGPWILFDFSPGEAFGRSMGEPGKWKAEYGRDFELFWAGFACLAGNNKRWAAELVSRADIQVAKGQTDNAAVLLQKACKAWPLYPPAVERLAKMIAAGGVDPGPAPPGPATVLGEAHIAGSNARDAGYWQNECRKICPEIKADIKFGNGIEFAGLSLSTNEVSAGDSLTVRYFWKCPSDGTRDKTWVFVHFLAGENILQDDHPLEKFKGADYQPYPELFVETRSLLVPKTAPEGKYQIRIGLYDASRKDQKRVAADTALPQKLNSVELPVDLVVKY